MIERGMNHGIRIGCTISHALQVIEIAAMRLRSSGNQRLGACIGASKTKYLMARLNELANDSRANKTRSTCDEDTHILFLLAMTMAILLKPEIVSAFLDYRRMSPVANIMPKPAKSPPPPARKPRTDALRNRELILEVAKKAFTRLGANASLDDIAKQAGVGPGTLYRHFPTRDALIEAVYHAEVEKLAAAAHDFAHAMKPLEALRAWMLLFVDHIAAKQIIAPALNTVVGGPSKLYAGSRSQIRGAIDALVKRAIHSGDIRADLDPFDLLRALIGVSHVASSPDWQQSAKRLVDILITGSRPTR